MRTKIKSLLASLLAVAMVLSLLPTAAFAGDGEDDGSLSVDSSEDVEYDSSEDAEYSVTMKTSYSYYNEEEDSTYYYVFDTDDLILSVEQTEESNDLPDGYTVEYYLCEDEHSNYVTLTNNGDNTATLSVDLSEDLVDEGYRSGYWVGVYAIVSYAGNEIAWYHDLWLEVLVAYDDYYTPGDYTIVLGDGDGIGNTFGRGYRDMDNVYGAYDEIDITDMEVTARYAWDDDAGAYVETDDEIIWLDGSYDNGGWSINTSSIGYATVTAWYTDADGEEQSCEFTVNVVGSRSWIDNYGFTDGLNTEDMLVGAQRELSMSYVVRNTVWDDDGNYWTEDTYYSLADLPDGYSVSLVPENENISAEITEDGTILVTANSTGGAWLDVQVLDVDGNDMGGASQWVGTRDDSYYTITGSLGDVPVGDTLDLSAVDYTLTYYYIDEDGNPCTEEVELDGENYYARLNIDNIDWNAWVYADGSSEEDALPALVRIGNWWTNMLIEVCDSDGNWLCDYWPGVSGYGYGAYIEESYDGKNYIYEMIEWPGNDYDYPEGYTVCWNVYVDTEDGWQDASDYGVTYSAEDNILTITEWGHTDIIVCSYAYYQGENCFYSVEDCYYTLHTFDLNRTKEATCTEEGYNYYVCTECGDSRIETISAGHSYVETVIAPTCTEGGKTEHKCSVCGNIYYTDLTSATGHTYVEDTSKRVEPTCTEAGSVTYTCSICGDTYTETLSATGHSYVETVIAATCTEGGKTEHKCSVCGNIYYTDLTSATGHTYEEDTAKRVEPTCTENGSVTYTCSSCGDTYTETLAVTGHTWDDGVVTTEPACTTEGVMTYTCSVCQDTYTETIAATGHSYVETVIAPTCTEGGKTEHKCSVCGNIYYTDLTSATGHTYAEDTTKRVEPTCTEDGSATYTCSSCGDTYTETLAATGHSYVETVIAPTCTEGGKTEHKCSICGNIYYTDLTSATGHTYVEDTAKRVEPTCTENGSVTYVCGSCGDSYTEITAVTGHSWDEGVVTKTATATEEGEITYTCTVCGETYTEVVEAIATIGDNVVLRSGNTFSFWYTLESDGPDLVLDYGREGDEVLIGDWDGDGIDTICVRRGNKFYFKNDFSSGDADYVITYGREGDEVLVGDWN
ncbi:MAG: hypothetical protein LIO75_08700, partial [Lachnospiraceae bacterium]|nr:hypothetical protein [Lachnospiraceae bacterium]